MFGAPLACALAGIQQVAIFCQPVVWTTERKSGEGDRYQLVLNAQLGPLATSFPYVQEGLCNECGEYRNAGIDAASIFSERRQLRFPRSSYGRQLIANTQERFGGALKYRLIVVSQNLYQFLDQLQMSGFWCEPGHLEG